MNLQQHALRGAIRAYQLSIRPIIGCNCRFYPHCSDYGMEAIATHGALTGAWLAGRRVLRCNPWHPGGYDPVPPPSHGLPAGTKGSPVP